jgi:uncharacterized protein (TIGR03435 family)
MMQKLLAERFKLTVHHENREMALFSLVVAKNGPKFKEAVETPRQGTAPTTPGPPVLWRGRRWIKMGFPLLPDARWPHL